MRSTNPKFLRGDRRFDPAQQVSSFAVDPKALHFVVNDTVVETRGQFTDYRPGDIWRMLQGTVFQK